MKLSATSASCVPNLWHAIPVGVETETDADNEYGSVCRCAGVRVWGCVCGQVCKSKSCGQLCCHATLMSRRMRPQNLTAKGFKLKKFNEHAYLIKARTHTHTFEECVAERQVEVAHVKQRIHLGTFVVVLAVAPHSVALFSRECNHQSCQDPSLLTSLRLTPVTPPVSTCSSTTWHPTSAATAADSLFAATASYAIRNAIENRISFAFCL